MVKTSFSFFTGKNLGARHLQAKKKFVKDKKQGAFGEEKNQDAQK